MSIMTEIDEAAAAIKAAADAVDLDYGAPDTFDLPDGRKVRVSAEPDPDCSINDYDCYGKYAFVERSRDFIYSAPRPEGFNGAARKVWLQSDQVWWQPWEGATEAEITEQWPAIRDLIEYGFKNLHIELLEVVTDSLDNEHEVVIADNWLGGIDSLDQPYLGELIIEQLHELLYELETK